MPEYMRLSIRILTLLFDTWSYPIKGKPFHSLPLSQRIDQVAAWENSRLEFRHGLIVFYRSFRSEEHTSELQSLMRSSYPVFCLQHKSKTEEDTTKLNKIITISSYIC